MGIAPVSAGSPGLYELRSSRASAVFGETGLTLRLPSTLQPARELGWRVAGGRAVKPQAEQPRAARLHRLVGPRSDWERDVPTYGGLRYRGVLPGVDLWFEERAEGHEYGFRAERGADLRRIQLEYAGARAVRVVEQGRALEVVLDEGVLREQGLRCTQEAVDGTALTVGCRFTDARPVGLDRWEYAIEVDVKDPERPVVVDPLVLWNTYLGSIANDQLRGIAQNEAGDVYVVGTVGGSPVTPPPDAGIGSLGGGSDVFVARFNADGGLSWSTLLGGNGAESGRAILVGSANEVYVAGTTTSSNLRGRLADGGVGDTLRGGSDGFVARLSPSGAALDWLLHLGGGSDDTVNKLVSNGAGKLFAAGETRSGDLSPVAGPPMKLPVVDWEGFVARIDINEPSTDWYIVHQAPGDDSVLDVLYRNDVQPLVYFTGGTRSETGTSVDAFLRTITGPDGPASALQPHIVRLGGSLLDEGRALSLSPSDDVVMWGVTQSFDFPADAGTRKGPSDIFAVAVGDFLMSGGSMQVKKSLLFGGSNGEELYSVTTDSSGRLYAGGSTTSPDFPLRNAFDSRFEVDDLLNGFVARVRLDVSPAVQWSSFVGGTGFDEVYALKIDNQKDERLFIGGYTTSEDLRYSDAGYLPNQMGSEDMFLMAVDVNALPDGGRLDPDVIEPGEEEGPDGGENGGDGGGDGGDGGTDGGDGGQDPGTKGPVSPLGWSCGATEPGGGSQALVLGVLAGLALLVSRRRPRA